MSLTEDVINAFKNELAKPDVKAAIETGTKAILEAGKTAAESVLPAPFKQLATGFLDALAEKGIEGLIHLEETVMDAFTNTQTITTKTGVMHLTYVKNVLSDPATG